MTVRDRLAHLVTETVEAFEERYAPGFELPTTFGGHLVGPDAVADVAYAVGGFGPGSTIAGLPVEDALRTVLRRVDGPGTHSFFSYRIAETLARFGSFEDNLLLSSMEASEVENLRVACDSTELLPLLDGLLPRNYVAVLARCELARQRLGILDDSTVLDELVERTVAMLDANADGFFDEAHDGAGRYDIYAADIFLFCEPLADRLGDVWTSGVRRVLDLVDALVTPGGASITWGRSTGLLSEALTIELAALARRRGLGDAERWSGHLATATTAAEGWFDRGVVTAYRHRAPEDYRGPQRRLQLTFDLLGKLQYAMRASDETETGTEAVAETHADAAARPTRDELRRFDDRAAVWIVDGDALGFALPLVSGRSSDYLPAPRRPGVFEVPVDSTIPCFLPTVHQAGGPLEPQRRYAPGEVPTSVEHESGRLTVVHDGFVAAHAIDGAHPRPGTVDATRRATYEVAGSELHIHEDLTFADRPTAVTVTIPSTRRRPLRVEARSDTVDVTTRTVDVAGVKEWQTAWGAIETVTEVEVGVGVDAGVDAGPSTTVRFDWSVAPKSRVALTSHDAGYVRTVYDPVSDPVGGRLAVFPWSGPERATDVAHIHWPEWCFGYGTSVEEHARIAATLRARGTHIVWTQHNLTPHLDEPDVYDPIYQVWADACDLAVHHSAWGREVVSDRYLFRPDCRHEVIPHPHFGPALTPAIHTHRDEAAARLGLRQGADAPAVRIGVIGAPRRQKDLSLVIDAVRRCERDDVELVLWSLSFVDPIPDDPRIVAHVYDNVDRDLYDLRLAACDVIALPFTEHTMLCTGTTSDLVAAGIPGLMTSWPYLTEHLGGLGIPMGDDVASWAAAIGELTPDRVSAAAAHAAELQDRYDPARIGLATARAIESLGVQRVG